MNTSFITNLPEDIVKNLYDTLDKSSQFSLSWTCKTFNVYSVIDKDYASTCARDGNLELLLWSECDITENTLPSAAQGGHINILEWARNKEYYITDDVSVQAAKFGHLHVLKWLKKYNYIISSGVSRQASSNGHLDILKWSHKHDHFDLGSIYCVEHLHVVEWYHNTVEDRFLLGACPSFAEKSCLDILQWIEKRIEISSSDISIIMTGAAKGGHLEIIKWLKNLDTNSLKISTYSAAASIGRIDILEWLIDNNCPYDSESWYLAAKNGHFKTLKWMKDNNDNFNLDYTKISLGSIEGGHLDILQWLVEEYDCNLLCFSYAHALKEGNAEMFWWLSNNTIQIYETEDDFESCYNAVKYGHLDILKWLIKKGFESQRNLYHMAASKGYFHILKWLKKKKFPLTSYIWKYAIDYGNIEILEWIKDQNVEWGEESSYCAVKSNNLTVLKWLFSNGCPLTKKCYKEAYEHNRMRIVKWLKLRDCPIE